MINVTALSEELKLCSTELSTQIFDLTELIRLKKLNSYKILNTSEELCFNSIVALASFITKTPGSAISFIDEKRQWLKAKIGDLVVEMPREYSLCNIAIQTPGKPLVINNIKKSKIKFSPEASDYFSERSKFNVQFYAGIPLVAPTGEAIGALCVMDNKPRKMSILQMQQLDLLAQLVIHLLETKK